MIAKNSYPEIRIGDLGKVFTGRTPSTEHPAYFGNDFPFITPGDMRQGKHARATARCVSLEGAELLKRIRLPENSVCVSCIGWQMGETIMTDRPSFTNQQINTIVPNSKVDPSFLYYSLSPRKQELLALGAMTGVRTPILNKSAFSDLKVKIPPLSVQRRIAGILSAYDELIENSQRRIRILEEMARALYREWFVHFRFPGHEKVKMVRPPSRPGGASAKTDGEIPQGWEVKPLNDVVDDIVDYRGKTPKKLNGDWSDEGILALSALNVKGGRLVSLEKSRCVNEDLYSRWMKNPLRRGDILMTSEAPLGELYFLCKEERYCLSQRLFSLRANSAVIAPVILYLCMESEQTQHELRARASGATVSGIRQSELRKISIVVPPRSMQEHAAPILQRLAEQKFTLDAQIQNLLRTRDLLLPRLLSGQIEIG